MIKKLFILALFLVLYSCKKDPKVYDYKGYPKDIYEIVNTKCATAGCHNNASREFAGDLSMESWNDLMAGTDDGPAVIPFASQFSAVFYHTNTFAHLGSMTSPTMPLNGSPLSEAEVIKIKNWIDAGAPNELGEIKFSDNLNRKKMYVTNQGCDVVTVIDAQTQLPMRYIEVGANATSIEGPHQVKVSHDRSKWAVTFVNGQYLEWHSANNDFDKHQVYVGQGSWNTLAFSNDDKFIYMVDWEAQGKVLKVDLTTNSVVASLLGLDYPHGVSLSPDGNFIYVTAQQGNCLYKIDKDLQNYSQVTLGINLIPSTTDNSFQPHEVIFSPDGSNYFVSCYAPNKNLIVAFKASNDSVLTTIPTGNYPVEFALHPSSPYGFVSCMNDTTIAGFKGVVTVFNYQTLQLVKHITQVGYEPHGISIDPDNALVYVISRNTGSQGPTPHHTGVCGRNGFITYIDLITLDLLEKKIELASDPYSAAFR